MGVSLHYVVPHSLKMQFIALACRLFRDSHTAEMLRNIFDEFDITNKIVNVVTDNAANFAKAFTLIDHDSCDQSGTRSNMVNG